MTSSLTAAADLPALLDRLETLYDQSVSNLRLALTRYARDGIRPDPEERRAGLFAYPALRIDYGPGTPPPTSRARLCPAQPARQLHDLASPARHCSALTWPSSSTISSATIPSASASTARRAKFPIRIVLDGADLALGSTAPAELSRWFPVVPSSPTSATRSPTARGSLPAARPARWPCSTGRGPISASPACAITPAPRPSISSASCCSPTMSATSTSSSAGRSTELRSRRTAASRRSQRPPAPPSNIGDTRRCRGADRRRRLAPPPDAGLSSDRADGDGITLVNIGVGPSNAKTICDHLAVLRPEAWLMIGHCGGLRPSQTIGDYVLAHAYLRDDHVLDEVLPPEIPLPAIAEVQKALFDAAAQVTGEDAGRLEAAPAHRHRRHHRRPQLGASLHLRRRFASTSARAVAIDMESATVAAQGYRFRVPYGTLLCVSDKPLHGETQAARPGQRLLRARDQPASAHRHRNPRPAPRRRRRPPQPQTPQLRRTAAALRRAPHVIPDLIRGPTSS